MGVKIPRVTHLLELAGDYAGVAVLVWLNPPVRVFNEMREGDPDRVGAALGAVVLGWNLVDDADCDLAIPTTAAAWDELPGALARQILDGWTGALEEHTSVPKAPAAPSSST